MGVLGGNFLSINSDESIGPNDTLLRECFLRFIGLSTISLICEKSESRGAGAGSSDPGIHHNNIEREDFRLLEDRWVRLGIVVGTFSDDFYKRTKRIVETMVYRWMT